MLVAKNCIVRESEKNCHCLLTWTECRWITFTISHIWFYFVLWLHPRHSEIEDHPVLNLPNFSHLSPLAARIICKTSVLHLKAIFVRDMSFASELVISIIRMRITCKNRRELKGRYSTWESCKIFQEQNLPTRVLEHVLKKTPADCCCTGINIGFVWISILFYSVFLKKPQITEDVNSLMLRETVKTVEVLGGHYFQGLILSFCLRLSFYLELDCLLRQVFECVLLLLLVYR